MAAKPAPAPEPTHCHGCGQRLPTFNRLTYPRAQSGDLVYCGFACSERDRPARERRDHDRARFR